MPFTLSNRCHFLIEWIILTFVLENMESTHGEGPRARIFSGHIPFPRCCSAPDQPGDPQTSAEPRSHPGSNPGVPPAAR